ncbi:hypothetical protein [Pseudarthrobacter oxydans]|jgi:hypothetical protein|uniref:hypothetical protein n=1 Tax=Pseudarthrobacter oxydans TaxID=1671 RepID=UPI00168BF15B|nr:hypothetical protein [Arthrobacter sp. S13_S34]
MLSVTARAVMRAVLGFSLLVAFTTSAAAVMCLQMDQTGSMAMTSAAPALAGQASDTASPVMADSVHSPPERACCFEQDGTPQAIAPPYRSSPDPASDVFSQTELQRVDSGGAPPGWFDPALKRPGHLAPSLTALSISRT